MEFGDRRRAIIDSEKCLITVHDLGSSISESPDGERSIRNCDGAVLLYDITSKASFNHVQGYCDRLRNLTSTQIPIYLVGNKLDASGKRSVKIADGKRMAEALDPRCPFIEVSAETGDNVEHLYFNLVRQIRRQRLEADGNKPVSKKRTNSSFKKTASTEVSIKKKGMVASFKQVLKGQKGES